MLTFSLVSFPPNDVTLKLSTQKKKKKGLIKFSWHKQLTHMQICKPALSSWDRSCMFMLKPMMSAFEILITLLHKFFKKDIISMRGYQLRRKFV